MKTTPQTKSYLRGILSSALTILALYPGGNHSYASGGLPVRNKAYLSIQINKDQNNKKHNVWLFNNSGRAALLFSVNGVEGKKYQLYVFDMDSRLVAQASIRNRQTTAVNNISKGDYLFEVFLNDQQVENGRLSVK
jgi:hypothetical protein